MKILCLCPDPGIPVLGRKGAAVHVRELVAALGRAGHCVTVAAPALTKSPWEKPASLEASLLEVRLDAGADSTLLTFKAFNQTLGVENGVPGHLRRILRNQDLYRAIKREFENDPPDCIYERASLYSIAGALLAKELHIPLVLEVNAPLALEQSTYRASGFGELAAQAERWVLVRADAVLTVSAELRDHVISLGVEPCRVHIVPNGVDPESFRPGPADPQVKARWNLDGRPLLGFVGGLRPWHGVEALPALLERLIPRYPGLAMAVVGAGPLRAKIEREFNERGLSEAAVFTGALMHEEVAGVIRTFDVALAPYPKLDHAFYFSPLKLFEYMACGVPVVAAAAGQISEIIENDATGLLYPPGDIDALTEACDRLLGDAALRQRLGRAAADKVRSRYTWDHNAARVTEVAQTLTRDAGRSTKRLS